MRVVVLEHPRIIAPARVEDVVNAPLSSCMFAGYVASMLRSGGHDVQLMDANLQGWTCDETVPRVCAVAPRLLAVNLVYMWDETALALDMLRRIKERLPECHVTLFGYYPTFGYEFLLRNSHAADSVIFGEPELTASELAQKIESREEWHGLQGIACRAFGRVVRHHPRPLVENLDFLPFPLRVERPVREARGVSPYILGSRGCYNGCDFCYINPFYGDGTRWRGRTPENIVEELRLLRSAEGLDYFYFADANFFGPGNSGQERAMKLAHMLHAEFPGVAFGLECRANDVKPDAISALHAAGLRDVFLGLESGCDKTLGRLRKHLSAETNARAVRTLRDAGIHVSFGYIMFEPDSTLGEVRESFEFLRQNSILDEWCVSAHVLHHRARVLMGTPMFRSLRSRPGASSESFGEYECGYRIADERVDALAQCCEPVLRRILSVQSGGAGLNTMAVDFFESCLSALERSPEAIPRDELEALARAAMKKLTKVSPMQNVRQGQL